MLKGIDAIESAYLTNNKTSYFIMYVPHDKLYVGEDGNYTSEIDEARMCNADYIWENMYLSTSYKCLEFFIPNGPESGVINPC